ncbi:MAG: hypothetical protein KJ077_27875 [Anaerolineae bacterium]|nr:hypothetical protein [Anaerolineae bacterium]
MGEIMWQPDRKDQEFEPPKENPVSLPNDVTGGSNSTTDDPGDDIQATDTSSGSTNAKTALETKDQNSSENTQEKIDIDSPTNNDVSDDPGTDIGRPMDITQIQPINSPSPLEPVDSNDNAGTSNESEIDTSSQDGTSDSSSLLNQQKVSTLLPDSPSEVIEDKSIANQSHLVPATVIEQLDTLIDEKKAAEIAKAEYPHKSIQNLTDSHLRGVAQEGTVYWQLEDEYDSKHLEDESGPKHHVILHPKEVKLQDGRPIEPDFAVVDDSGNIKELVDAKGYIRKDTRNPEASASSLTHMQNLTHASRYAQVDESSVEAVKFYAPWETANMPQVQEAVSELSQEGRPISIEKAGTEAELKQRMTDLRTDPAERFKLPDTVLAELKQIQALPVEERRAAMGKFMLSSQDPKGDESTEGRNIRWNTRVERNGEGITIIDNDGQEHTIWYTEMDQTSIP